MMHQSLQLAERPHVVIGTQAGWRPPAVVGGTATVFRNVRFLVIDEADRLLELGFSADVSSIIQQLPPKRQTLLFSATISQPLQRLRELALNNPHVADLAPKETVPAALELQYCFVPANVRDAYLVHCTRRHRGGRMRNRLHVDVPRVRRVELHAACARHRRRASPLATASGQAPRRAWPFQAGDAKTSGRDRCGGAWHRHPEGRLRPQP